MAGPSAAMLTSRPSVAPPSGTVTPTRPRPAGGVRGGDPAAMPDPESQEEQPPVRREPRPGPPEPSPSGVDGEDRSFAADMGRLFVIPAVIVALSVLIFLLFSWLASDRRSAQDYLQEVRHGVTGRKWQAAFELSRVLTRDEEARRDPAVAMEIAETLADPEVEDPRVKRYLLLALQELNNPSTAPAIRTALSDEDGEVRLYAARALGALRDEGAVPGLVEMLAAEDPGLRKMALHSLGRIGEPSAAPPMRARLDDAVEDVRWNAALGLAMLGDGSGAPVIRQMLDPAHLERIEGITDRQMIDARINAVHGAFLIGGEEMRKLVEHVSATDASLKVRDAALRALEQWR